MSHGVRSIFNLDLIGLSLTQQFLRSRRIMYAFDANQENGPDTIDK